MCLIVFFLNPKFGFNKNIIQKTLKNNLLYAVKYLKIINKLT